MKDAGKTRSQPRTWLDRAREFAMEKGIVSEKYFDKATWFKLPLAYRKRWWTATDWGKLDPPPELVAEGKALAEAAEKNVA